MSDFDFRDEDTPRKRQGKSRAKASSGCAGCGVVVAILFGALLVVGVVLAVVVPSKTSKTQTAEERQKEGMAEFVAISNLDDKAERNKRLEEWMKKYPDLVQNFQDNIKKAADEEERQEGQGVVAGQNGKPVSVKGHMRDGKYVAPHQRAAPGQGTGRRK